MWENGACIASARRVRFPPFYRIRSRARNLLLLESSSDGLFNRRRDVLFCLLSIPEGLNEQVVDVLVLFLAKLRDTDGHVLVAGLGLRTVRTTQVVPPRQAKAEVAVGLFSDDGMVHAMHPPKCLGYMLQPMTQVVDQVEH